MNVLDRSFYLGIITALNLLDLHGQETIYDELATMCDVKDLVKCAIENGDLEWSGLHKRKYTQEFLPKTLRIKYSKIEKYP